MAGPLFKDRVWETSTTTGQGDIALAGAVVGYNSFASRIAVGETFYYVVDNRTGTEWELGVGRLINSTTFVRDRIVNSSNNNLHVNLSAGTKDVFIDLPAEYADDAVNAMCFSIIRL